MNDIIVEYTKYIPSPTWNIYLPEDVINLLKFQCPLIAEIDLKFKDMNVFWYYDLITHQEYYVEKTI